MRYEVYIQMPILLLAQYIEVYLQVPTYIVMRGKGYNVMMMVMMTTKLAPDTGTRHYYQIAGICFFSESEVKWINTFNG